MFKPKPKNRGGKRSTSFKPKLIDGNQVERLASIGCSIEEIAYACNCCRDTIENRFRDRVDRGKEIGKTKLRRALWKSAGIGTKAPGSVRAQIWLSKQVLGMSEKVTMDSTIKTEADQTIRTDLEKCIDKFNEYAERTVGGGPVSPDRN